MVEAPKKAPVAEARLIVPFVKSVRHVLNSMVGWEVTIDQPRLKAQQGPEYDYSGIISFSGTLLGTVVVSFHKELAVRLVAAFVGGEVAPDTADFADALGEITNLIVGVAKTELGLNASISVPSVIMGSGHIVTRPSNIPCIVVPCRTEAGVFSVEVSIKAN